MVFTKLLLENALAIRTHDCEAASKLLLPKVAHCIPVLPSRCIRKCAARILKRSSISCQLQDTLVLTQRAAVDKVRRASAYETKTILTL